MENERNVFLEKVDAEIKTSAEKYLDDVASAGQAAVAVVLTDSSLRTVNVFMGFPLCLVSQSFGIS